MDLPSHLLWTYGIEKSANLKMADSGLSVATSLIASALPDVLETIPLLAVLAAHPNKYGLKEPKEIIRYANELVHNNPDEFRQKFPRINNLSFLVHSLLFYFLLDIIIFFIKSNLLLPFAFGYGLHLVIDTLTHNDYFSVKPFYPLSSISIKGVMTWYKSKLFLRLDFFLLFILYTFLFLYKF